MKRLYQYYTADAINLAGGVPMDSCFPFETIDITLQDGTKFAIGGKGNGNTLSMNYLRGDGVPAVRDWIQAHVAKLHSKGRRSCAYSYLS